MKREKWMEEADELISQILDLKENKKSNEMELDNAKNKLAEILEEHNLQEYQGTTGKCNFVDSERKGLVKDEVEYLENHLYDEDVTKEDIERYVDNTKSALSSLEDEFNDLGSCLDDVCDELESVYKTIYNLNE